MDSIPDLKGKHIGVPMKSRPEFALDRFLFVRGIDASSVTLVDVPVDRSVDALVNGEVDAVTTWQPYIDGIKERMGDGVLVWSTQGGQPSFTLLIGTGKLTAENPAPITRFLKSLIQAESYIARYPAEARALIQDILNYSEAYMASVWPDYYFSVSLDQGLVAAMEDEARWMIKNGLAGEKQVPNFMDYIYVHSLEAANPGAVNIIR